MLWQGLAPGSCGVRGTLGRPAVPGRAAEPFVPWRGLAAAPSLFLRLPLSSWGSLQGREPLGEGALAALLEWCLREILLPPHCTQAEAELECYRYGWPGSGEGV